MEALPGMERGLPVLPATERVWGIDSDTKRVSIAALMTVVQERPARLVWETLSLPGTSGPLYTRQARALETVLLLVHRCKIRWGVPTRVLIEEPFAASANTLAAQQRALGVLLAGLGLELGLGVDVRLCAPQSWKLAATGHGKGPGLAAVKDKHERRRLEKLRIFEWARSVGYTGELQDEADACGVAVAQAVMLERRSDG